MHNQTSETNNELPLILSIAGRKLAESPEPQPFLDWMAEAGPVLAPTMSAGINPQSGSPSEFFRLMGVQLYNITPLPANDFRPCPIPKPKRNEPCLCGSGRKYKQCCERMENIPMLEGYNMLRHVLDSYPQKAMGELPHSRIDTEALADTAMQWLSEGDERRALALLEPWFKGNGPLTRRHQPLFDPMMDVYLIVHKPRKRQQLLERGCQAKDSNLQADAWQRKASMLMDEGDTAGAWAAFKQAQRVAPDSPALAILELTLLCANNETEQARARAQFWLARLQRKGFGHPELLELLTHCTSDPVGALRSVAHDAPEAQAALLVELVQALDDAPVPKALYTLEDHGDVAVLQSPPKLAQAEDKWGAATELWHELSPWECLDDWAPLLLRQKELWHSAMVISDLLNLLAGGDDPDLNQMLYEPLIQRSEALIKLTLNVKPPAQELPWGFLENRPFLSLIHLIAEDYFAHNELERACAYAELLLELNPNDNQGVRWDLAAAYLRRNQPQKVLQLAEQYPDEAACHMPLNRILALYMLNRPKEAKLALTTAAERHQTALNMLLKAKAKQPEMSPFGFTLGGEDEAWLYRQATLPEWTSSGALKWARAAMKGL
ncbi:SEC-C metal-binding domain-containing protein [uncultured Gilvimarinus sp.]|uniref:SEC-C metal-binding domain-containing protein n=1 Tax=uncultured Gilvimarinus sp. TaxID=1689143 RepID=UPI0030DC79F6